MWVRRPVGINDVHMYKSMLVCVCVCVYVCRYE